MQVLDDLLGTVEEHEDNFQRLLGELKDFRAKHKLDDDFSDRLSNSSEFTKYLVPIRCVKLPMAKKIAQNAGVYSLRSAVEDGLAKEKEKGDGRGISLADIKYGLDRFTYAGFGRTIGYSRYDYGNILILLFNIA